jgi:hypothetical protein
MNFDHQTTEAIQRNDKPDAIWQNLLRKAMAQKRQFC